jgi:hypothetical protein
MLVLLTTFGPSTSPPSMPAASSLQAPRPSSAAMAMSALMLESFLVVGRSRITRRGTTPCAAYHGAARDSTPPAATTFRGRGMSGRFSPG